jgi:hypothetical protein
MHIDARMRFKLQSAVATSTVFSARGYAPVSYRASCAMGRLAQAGGYLGAAKVTVPCGAHSTIRVLTRRSCTVTGQCHGHGAIGSSCEFTAI